MLLNRPKSSRLLSRGQQKGNENVVSSSTTALGMARKDTRVAMILLILIGRRSSRSSSGRRDDKLPTLAQVNKEIMDKSAELLGKKALTPQFLAPWIADKRGDKYKHRVC